MSGKKAAITLIGIVLLVCLLIFIAIKLFFATYEPKQPEEAALLAPTSHNTYIK